MNKMIRIYSCNETDFSSNGLAILDEAKDVCITHELNGSYNLQFEYPIDWLNGNLSQTTVFVG